MSYVNFDAISFSVPSRTRGDRELIPLLSCKLESGYQCVYRIREDRWRAKAFKRHLGYRRTAREAAMLVVEFWKGMFGEDWGHFFRARFCCGWFTERVRRPDGLLAARGLEGLDPLRPGSWVVEVASNEACRLKVYHGGRVKYLPPPPAKSDVFAGDDDAVRYYRRWVKKHFGKEAFREIRQTTCEV